MSEGPERIVLGTRGSALALAQAELTEAALRAAHPGLEVERKIIKTTGDRRTDVPLAEVAKVEGHLDKGVFIKELEVALAEGEIDVAVHSMKDLPSELDEGFEVAAVLPRAPVGDVLLTKRDGGLAGLVGGATVATSSVRRQKMLLWMRPDLKVTDIRGNVPTRIRKLHELEGIDGVILAEAGLVRLGLMENGVVRSGGHDSAAEVLDAERFLPAAGQGAVALEIHGNDAMVRGLCEAINDEETLVGVSVERKFLELLGAGCETPVGVLSRVEGGELALRAMVFEAGESEPLQGEARGARTDTVGLAQMLIDSLTRGAGNGA